MEQIVFGVAEMFSEKNKTWIRTLMLPNTSTIVEHMRISGVIVHIIYREEINLLKPNSSNSNWPVVSDVKASAYASG